VYVPSYANQMLYVFDFDANGKLIFSLRLADKPWWVTVSPDGRFLLASLEKSLALLEVSAVGDLLLRATLSERDRYYAYFGALFSTDGNQIFVASNKLEEYRGIRLLRDGVITTYDLEGKRLDQVSTGGVAWGLVRSSRGELAAIAGDNRLVVLTPRA
jgi:hypothetical protein